MIPLIIGLWNTFVIYLVKKEGIVMGRPVRDYEARKYGFHLPVDLMDRVRGRLEAEGVTMNALVRSLLVEWDSKKEEADRESAKRKLALRDW
jgi:hypothetical protein